MQLDLDRQTLVYTINEVEFVTPFTNVCAQTLNPKP